MMANTPFSPGFLPTDNPISQWVSPRRNALLGFGAGMLSPGLGGAATGAMQGMALDRQYAEDAAKTAETDALKTKYAQWFTEQGQPQIAQGIADGIVEPGKAYWDFVSPKPAGDAPSNVQEWEYYSQLSPEQQTQYLNMKRSNSPLNIGTGFVTQDPANPGSIIGAPIAINNEQEAYDKGFGGVTGTAAGEVSVLADSVSSKMPGLRSVVDTLSSLADTATYTQSGQAMDSVKRELGLPVGQGAIDRASYIAIVDNQVLPLLRDTFGAAFTEREGATLRATLGDPNKSPAEKKAILDAFIAQKERDVAAMAAQSGAPVVRVFNQATGRLE